MSSNLKFQNATRGLPVTLETTGTVVLTVVVSTIEINQKERVFFISLQMLIRTSRDAYF